MKCFEMESVYLFRLPLIELPGKEKGCYGLLRDLMPKEMLRSYIFHVRHGPDIDGCFVMARLLKKGCLQCVRGQQRTRNLIIEDEHRTATLKLYGQYAIEVNVIEEGDLVCFINVELDSVPYDIKKEMLMLSADPNNSSFKLYFSPMYRKRKRPEVPYLKIPEAKLSPKKSVNIFGIFLGVQEEKSQDKKQGNTYTMLLMDPTVELVDGCQTTSQLSVTFFEKNYFQFVSVGSVVRLHNLKIVTSESGGCSGLMNNYSQSVYFTCMPDGSVGISSQCWDLFMSKIEWDMVKQLQDSWLSYRDKNLKIKETVPEVPQDVERNSQNDDILVPAVQQQSVLATSLPLTSLAVTSLPPTSLPLTSLVATSLPTTSIPKTALSSPSAKYYKLLNIKTQRLVQLTEPAFFDLFCQVVAIYFRSQPRTASVLRVWDGTKLAGTCQYGFDIHSGQGYGEDLLFKDQSLVTDAGNHVIDIDVYDEYIGSLHSLKPGNFVNIINIRAMTKYDASVKGICWSFTLHGGGIRRGIKLCTLDCIGVQQLKNDLEKFHRNSSKDTSSSENAKIDDSSKRKTEISNIAERAETKVMWTSVCTTNRIDTSESVIRASDPKFRRSQNDAGLASLQKNVSSNETKTSISLALSTNCTSTASIVEIDTFNVTLCPENASTDDVSTKKDTEMSKRAKQAESVERKCAQTATNTVHYIDISKSVICASVSEFQRSKNDASFAGFASLEKKGCSNKTKTSISFASSTNCMNTVSISGNSDAASDVSSTNGDGETKSVPKTDTKSRSKVNFDELYEKCTGKINEDDLQAAIIKCANDGRTMGLNSGFQKQFEEEIESVLETRRAYESLNNIFVMKLKQSIYGCKENEPAARNDITINSTSDFSSSDLQENRVLSESSSKTSKIIESTVTSSSMSTKKMIANGKDVGTTKCDDCPTDSRIDTYNKPEYEPVEWSSLTCVSELSRHISGLTNISSFNKVLESPCPMIFRVKGAIFDTYPRVEDVDEIVQWKCSNCERLCGRLRGYCQSCVKKDMKVALMPQFVFSLRLCDQRLKTLVVTICGKHAVELFCGITPTMMHNDVNTRSKLQNILKFLCPNPGSITPSMKLFHCFLFSEMVESRDHAKIIYKIRHTKLVNI